jgi:plastocyanin
MKAFKIFSMICLSGLLALSMNSCSKSDASTVPGSNANLVTIQSMAFQPATITVVIGSKITWTNMDAVAHTVTSDDGTSFDSGNINPQGTFSFTATQVGSYAYHSSIQPTMHGTLQVVTK